MKTCKAENCFNPVFGSGFCNFHQWKRTDKKPKKITVRAQGTRTKDFNFGFESEIDLFNWLWQEAKNEKGQVICPFTGENLNRFYNTLKYFNCFSHVLPKGKYTYFKLNPKNIAVVFPDFHVIVDQGTTIDRANHPMWKFEAWDRKKEELKIQYQEFKKMNLLA